jgi:hypothetical protein
MAATRRRLSRFTFEPHQRQRVYRLTTQRLGALLLSERRQLRGTPYGHPLSLREPGLATESLDEAVDQVAVALALRRAQIGTYDQAVGAGGALVSRSTGGRGVLRHGLNRASSLPPCCPEADNRPRMVP